MTYLKKIREAKTLKNIAHILGVQPKTVSYLLYILPEAKKYRSFEIPKRNGGKRLINAPESRLKMVQRRLANVLYGCVAEAENGKDSISCIEDSFDPELFKTTIDGKKFDPSKKHNTDDTYGKTVFATKVVRPNADKINFSGFEKLLDRIIAVLNHYEGQKSSPADS